MARLTFDKLSLNLPTELPLAAAAARKDTPPFEDHLRRAAENAPRGLQPTPPREERPAQSDARSEPPAETHAGEADWDDDARTAAADRARSDRSGEQAAGDADEHVSEEALAAESGTEPDRHDTQHALAAAEAAQRTASETAADAVYSDAEPTAAVSETDVDGTRTGHQHRAEPADQPHGPAGARGGGTDGPSNVAAPSTAATATGAAAAVEADTATASDQATAASEHARAVAEGSDSRAASARNAPANASNVADASNGPATSTPGEETLPDESATSKLTTTDATAATTATLEAAASGAAASGGRRERRSHTQAADGAAQQPAAARATANAAAAAAATAAAASDLAAASAASDVPLDDATTEPAAEPLPAASTSGGSGDTRPAATEAEPGEAQSPRLAGPTAERVTREASGDSANGLTSAQRMRLIQRVSRAMHTLSGDGGHLRLRLSPPELGALRIEVTVRGGALAARLEAETSAARDVLLDGLPQLRERLAEQGIRVEQFDVDLFERGPDGSSQQAAGEGREGAPPRERSHRPAAARQPASEATESAGAAGGVSSDGRLNVIV